MTPMAVAVITGGRDRTPTLFEFDQLAEVVEKRGITTIRQGDCRGTDKAVGAWVKARGLAAVETWPAEEHGAWPACGPKRNRAMLDGPGKARADVLIHFRGGRGTADCTGAALERGIPVEFIVDTDEPRPWNRHHGEPPGLNIYVGRGSPLGNPFTVELQPGETREQAAPRILDAYKRWLWTRIKAGDRAVLGALDSIADDHYIVCSCWPRHCHAEVIVKAWRWRRSAETRKVSPPTPAATPTTPRAAGPSRR